MLRNYRAVLVSCLLVVPLAVLAQTEAGLVVNGVFSSQQRSVSILAIPCPITGCSPSSPSANNGVSFEGFLAHRFANFHVASLSGELPVLVIPNRGTDVPGVSFSTVAVTPGLRLNFVPSRSVSPFLSVGGGFAHFSGGLPSATQAAVVFGGGVDFKTPLPHLGVRMQLRDLITPGGPSRALQNFLAGGGVVFKF
jgi:hypothetical protein